LGLGGIQLRRLAEDAEHGDAVAADRGVEIGQLVDRLLVDAAVVMKRRRRNREGACSLGGEFCHVRLYPCSSFRDAPLGADPESILWVVVMDSGLATSSRPGMTVT